MPSKGTGTGSPCMRDCASMPLPLEACLQCLRTWPNRNVCYPFGTSGHATLGRGPPGTAASAAAIAPAASLPREASPRRQMKLTARSSWNVAPDDDASRGTVLPHCEMTDSCDGSCEATVTGVAVANSASRGHTATTNEQPSPSGATSKRSRSTRCCCSAPAPAGWRLSSAGRDRAAPECGHCTVRAAACWRRRRAGPGACGTSSPCRPPR